MTFTPARPSAAPETGSASGLGSRKAECSTVAASGHSGERSTAAVRGPDGEQGKVTAALDACREIIARHAAQAGGLLPALHALQDTLGHIPTELVSELAAGFNISRAEVHGVISFYPHFRSTAAGRHVLQVCRAESCQAMGGEALVEHIRRRLACDFHEISADGTVTLEPVYCLGLCAQSPAIMLDAALHVHVTPEKLDQLLDHAAAAAPPVDAGEQGFGAEAVVGTGPGVASETVGAPDTVVAPDTVGAPETVVASDTGVAPVAVVASDPIVVYVPRDAAALAAGADEVACAITQYAQAHGLPVQVVRNGSRGMLWLEPLVEVVTQAGRIAYGPVQASDVPGLLDAGMLQGRAHPLSHGLTEEIPYLKRQERLTFARVGVIDPLSLKDYSATGGWQGLQRALSMSPGRVVEEVSASGLRGRGGAAFPTGIKWQTVLDTPAGQKYVVCNADEGDSGTFADRLLMEGDPYSLIEGMVIASMAVGATQGYIYIRSEYPHAIETMGAAIERARQGGWLGDDIQGSGRRFELELRKGAGVYICGEETSLLESLEGKRGVVRAKPPVPAIQGLFGQPTVVNNVLSLATVPIILARGAAHYRDYGAGRSHGTQPFQLAGNLKRGGLVEKAFGLSLRELLYDFGGGSASGRPLRAVQVGGPLGAYLPESQWDIPLTYEAYAEVSAMLGHGGLVAFDDTVDMLRMARYAMEFCAVESCGKCTPCRIGSVRGVETLDKIAQGGPAQDQQLELLRDLCDTMLGGSLCALGGMAPYPVLSALNHFPEDFANLSGRPDTRAG